VVRGQKRLSCGSLVAGECGDYVLGQTLSDGKWRVHRWLYSTKNHVRRQRKVLMLRAEAGVLCRVLGLVRVSN
jgi:hypothetical protein